MIGRIALTLGDCLARGIGVMLALLLLTSQAGCDGCQPSRRYQLKELAYQLPNELCRPDSYYYRCFCNDCTPGFAREGCYELIHLARRECMTSRIENLPSMSLMREELLSCIEVMTFFFGMHFKSESPWCEDVSTWNRRRDELRRQHREQREVDVRQ